MTTSIPDHLPPSRPDGRLRAQFWIATGIFIIGAILFQVVDIDLAAEDWFYQDGHFIGRGSFWADKLIHKKGGQFIVGIALAALALLAASLKIPRLVPWRRAAVYLLCRLALGSGLVGGLKSVTNVDCPWDLARYGGAKAMPYVHIYGDKPDALAQGACFPGGHSSGAFSLFALYFLARQYRPEWSKPALATVLVLGGCWGLGQWARGAHFPSHDFYTAFICWTVAMGLYRLFWKEQAV